MTLCVRYVIARDLIPETIQMREVPLSPPASLPPPPLQTSQPLPPCRHRTRCCGHPLASVPSALEGRPAADPTKGRRRRRSRRRHLASIQRRHYQALYLVNDRTKTFSCKLWCRAEARNRQFRGRMNRFLQVIDRVISL